MNVRWWKGCLSAVARSSTVFTAMKDAGDAFQYPDIPDRCRKSGVLPDSVLLDGILVDLYLYKGGCFTRVPVQNDQSSLWCAVTSRYLNTTGAIGCCLPAKQAAPNP